MRRSGEQLRLGAFFNPTGHHVASWRHPDAQADAGINFEHYVEIAQTAERAKMDMVFLADNISVREAASRGARPLGAIHRQYGAADADLRARRRHQAYRPRRHRLDQLQRALSRRPQVRLARLDQPRPRRLEPGHLGPGGRRLQFLPRRALRARRALRPRARVRRGRHRAVGLLGRRRLHPRQGERHLPRSRPRCMRSTTRANGSRCAGR